MTNAAQSLYFRAMNQATPPQVIDEETIAILRCPVTHSKLRLEEGFLVSEVGGLRYPVRNGIPDHAPRRGKASGRHRIIGRLPRALRGQMNPGADRSIRPPSLLYSNGLHFADCVTVA